MCGAKHMPGLGETCLSHDTDPAPPMQAGEMHDSPLTVRLRVSVETLDDEQERLLRSDDALLIGQYAARRARSSQGRGRQVMRPGWQSVIDRAHELNAVSEAVNLARQSGKHPPCFDGAMREARERFIAAAEGCFPLPPKKDGGK